MSNKNVLHNFLLLILLAICSTLLCFIGVYAIDESIKIKLEATFSPDVFCSVEYSTDKITWIKIFDNNNYSDFIDNEYIESTSQNTIHIKTTVSGLITSSLFFRVTNYNTNKNIMASIQDYKINEAPSTLYTANSVVCPSYAFTPTVNDNLALTMTGSAGTSVIEVTLKIQQVFLVDYSNSSNLTNENEYVSNDSNAVLNLVPYIGSYLPESVEVIINDITLSSEQYSYNKSLKTIIINSTYITGNIYIYCDAVKVYTLHKYEDTNTITNGYVSGTVYYEYYIEMGRYPQTYVGSALNATLESAYNNGSMISGMTFAQESGANISYLQTIYTGTALSSTQVIWADYNNKTYARSASFAIATGINYTSGDALPKTSGQYRWYEVQPVYWTVLDTTNNNLTSLYYRDNMLYTDSLMGKGYLGGLLVMSELALDTIQFSSTKTTFASGHLLYDFLNSSSGIFAKYSGIGKYFSASGSATSNYVRSNSLTTYGYYDGVMKNQSAINANIFALSGLFNEGEDFNNTTYTQSYNYASYFYNGYVNSSIGITSPTDYALGHSANASSSSSYTRAWSSNVLTTSYTSVYWLRSGQTDIKATMINLTGSINIGAISTFKYTVRPCLIVNLNA